MGSPVKVSYMSDQELEEYKVKHANKRHKKMDKPVDWRWPQNRKRGELKNGN
ncbi:hypothetical protein ACQKFO_23145 [Rossellomorea sp. NPDC071047]|uniref:hypothetical protein n=1 Tax=Rossellomorea sp. NPDC071047 TaxID=3390675 RepID=UPI003D060B34